MSSDSDDPIGATLSYRKIIEREIENALKEMNRPSVGTFSSLTLEEVAYYGLICAPISEYL